MSYFDDLDDPPRADASHSSQAKPALSLAFVGTLFLATVAVLYLWEHFSLEDDLFDPNAAPRPVTARGDLAADELATIELFETSSPSVVHINTSTLRVRRRLFSSDVLELPEGTGSGIVWDADGHVVTNYHVIRNADRAEVALWDQSTWPARLVGYAEDYDLAVLKVDAPSGLLRPIPIGRSEMLRVGQKVFAIGNPFGLDQTLTTGVISGLDREIMSVGQRSIEGVIQTDAAINPGNSGAPLLDSAGLLIGVNTAIYSLSGNYAGVGFAVPVDTVNRVVPHLIRDGKVVRPVMGVMIGPDSLARSLGVEGCVIRDVIDGTSAARAGFRGLRESDDGQLIVGDVIVGVESTPIRRRDDLFAALESYSAGDEVTIHLERRTNGNRRVEEIPVVLQSLE